MKTKVLLFGSNGQLGLKIKEVISSNFKCESFDREECDITNTQVVRKIISHNPNSILINCAAYTKVDQAEDDKNSCLSANYHAVKNMVNLCNEFNLLFIHFSTDYVFKGDNQKAYKETDEHLPINFYGESKKLADEYILSHANDFYLFRVSWVYDKKGRNFLNTIKNLLTEKIEIKVVNDQYGVPTSTSFIAEIVEYFLINLNQEKIDYGLYNCVPNGFCNWYEFATLIKKLLQDKNKLKLANEKIIPVDSSTFKTRAKRPMNSLLDNNKIKESIEIKVNDWTHYLESEIS